MKNFLLLPIVGTLYNTQQVKAASLKRITDTEYNPSFDSRLNPWVNQYAARADKDMNEELTKDWSDRRKRHLQMRSGMNKLWNTGKRHVILSTRRPALQTEIIKRQAAAAAVKAREDAEKVPRFDFSAEAFKMPVEKLMSSSQRLLFSDLAPANGTAVVDDNIDDDSVEYDFYEESDSEGGLAIERPASGDEDDVDGLGRSFKFVPYAPN